MPLSVVFDLDGTLVDSLPGIAEGVNRALASLGLPARRLAEVRGMVGRGALNLCAAALGYADASLAPQAELRAMHEAFRREYPHCWQGAEFTHPYPGVPEMLARLASAQCRMAVLSNKPHEVTLPMVRQLFPSVPFDPVMGFSEKFPRKPDPAALRAIAGYWGVPVEQVTLVGDSRFDAMTAEHAPCRLLLLDWGYSGGDLSRWQAQVVSGTVALLNRLGLPD